MNIMPAIIAIILSTFSLFMSITFLIYKAVNFGHSSKCCSDKCCSENECPEELNSGIELSGCWGTQEISVETDDLDHAYIIYANNRGDELDLDDLEDTLKGEIENGLTAAPDIKADKFEYRYFFLYLENLEDCDELYLIFTKILPGLPEAKILEFNAVSGIGVFGLGNERHENAEEYEGERIMAEEYARILEELPKYMGQ